VSVCSYCGLTLRGSGGLCPDHTLIPDSNWAIANRIMCDFIHRGIVVSGPRKGAPAFDELEMVA
jgi:hypothetical protein